MGVVGFILQLTIGIGLVMSGLGVFFTARLDNVEYSLPENIKVGTVECLGLLVMMIGVYIIMTLM